jgi:hypothetical protein
MLTGSGNIKEDSVRFAALLRFRALFAFLAQTASNESMNRPRKSSWMRADCVLNKESPWAMQVG